MSALAGRRWWIACGLVLAGALAAAAPTAGDFGLTWDEPAYRHSQLHSAEWWQRLASARSRADLEALVTPHALLYYWPYSYFGIDFHPPLAGQFNLLTYALTGRWVKDYPARRLASVVEYSSTIALLFGFLARRYGPWAGGVAAGSLLLIPRVYAHGHIAGTDTPGLLLWALTAVTFWKGLHEPGARRWRVAVGGLLGLAFLEKMAAVAVLLPLLAWLALGRLPRTFRRGGRAAWIDGVLTLGAMLVPLGLAFLEIRRLARLLPPPDRIDLYNSLPSARLSPWVLLVPLAVWIVRRAAGWIGKRSPVWGVERPGLETVAAILAFAPAVGWLGNPVWWRDALVRLAHYYTLNTARRGALPDIRILFNGIIYEYSLPWPNAWVLIAITVPPTILAASLAGLAWAGKVLPRDRLPLYCLVHLATLPALRMLDTPAHDGVRLFLPTFFFLAAFAGWGTVATADLMARLVRLRLVAVRAMMAGLVLAPAAWALVRIHPFELSYYNALIGGPAGAWRAGFELTYWYDALDPVALRELNDRLPRGAAVEFSSDLSNPVMVVQDLQALGHLRGDIQLGSEDPDHFPFMWLLTHDSKATPFTRLLFAMRPWYARTPSPLGGLRVLTVVDPLAVSRAWALRLLIDGGGPEGPEPPATAPGWVRRFAPPLRRLWGEGLTRAPRPTARRAVLEWARTDPEGLRAAARTIVARRGRDLAGHPDAERLMAWLLAPAPGGESPPKGYATTVLLRTRPEALLEAVEILIARPDAVRRIALRAPYTDPATVGGYLDRDLPPPGPPRTPSDGWNRPG